jgi:GGDEF domain-containing protein
MGIPSSAAPVRQIGVVDLATGLPGRTAGEILLAEKAVGGMCCSLGLFVAENVRSIAARHGAGAEDVILLHVAQHLVKQAPKGSFVCRWTGPSILAVNTPSNDPQQDARVWNQIAAKAVEGTITNERRSLMIKINLSCMARVVEPGKQMPALFAQMDQFVAEVTKG